MMADKDDSMMGEDAMMDEIMLMEDGNTRLHCGGRRYARLHRQARLWQ